MPPGHLERATYLPLLFLILKNVICGSLAPLARRCQLRPRPRRFRCTSAAERISFVGEKPVEWGKVVEGGGQVVA